MPQTREHVAILALLGVRAAVVALSKADRVEPPRLEAVRAEISALLADTPFAGAPVFALAATRRRCRRGGAARPSACGRAGAAAAYRRRPLPPGRRPCVHAGRPRHRGDRHGLRWPSASATACAGALRPARTRAQHPRQQQPAEAGHAGQRCALNLAGIDKDAIARGDWVLDPVLLAPPRASTCGWPCCPAAATAALGPAPHPPGHHAPACQHRAAGGDTIEPGAQAFAQLVFAARSAHGRATASSRAILRPPAPWGRRGAGPVRAGTPAPRATAGLPARPAADGRRQRLAPLLAQAPRGITVARLRCLAAGAPGGWRLPADALRIGAPTRTRPASSSPSTGRPCRRACWKRWRPSTRASRTSPDAGTLRRIAFAGTPVPDPLWLGLLDATGAAPCAARALAATAHALRQSERRRTSLAAARDAAAGGRRPPGYATSPPRSGAGRRDAATAAQAGAPGQCTGSCATCSIRTRIVRALAAPVSGLVAHHGSVDAARFRDAVGLRRKRAIQFWSSSTASVTLAGSATRACCAPTASGSRGRRTAQRSRPQPLTTKGHEEGRRIR